MEISPWVRGLFGEHAPAVQSLVPAALRQAHDFAAAAQGSSGTLKRDPYGHTLKNTQHERLVAAVAQQLPACFAAFRPRGASYELVRFPENGVVLYPWRYGSSTADRRENARMQFSGTRQDLLTGAAVDPQLTIEHARLSVQEVHQQLDDDAAALEQLRSLARVVLIAYASNPRGLFTLGWGEADLVDERGSLHWRHWEDLPTLPASGEIGGATTVSTNGPRPGSPLRPLSAIVPKPEAEVARFDDAPLDDELVRPRLPGDGEPTQDPGISERRGTGTDQPGPDAQP